MQLTKQQKHVVASLQKDLQLVKYTSSGRCTLFEGHRTEKVRTETVDSLLEKGIIEKVNCKDTYHTFKLIKEIKFRK